MLVGEFSTEHAFCSAVNEGGKSLSCKNCLGKIAAIWRSPLPTAHSPMKGTHLTDQQAYKSNGPSSVPNGSFLWGATCMGQPARHLLALHRLSEAVEPKWGFEEVKQVPILLYSSVFLGRVFPWPCFRGVNGSGMVKAGAATSSPQGPPAICIPLLHLHIAYGCFHSTMTKLNCDKTIWPAKL